MRQNAKFNKEKCFSLASVNFFILVLKKNFSVEVKVLNEAWRFPSILLVSLVPTAEVKGEFEFNLRREM